MHAFSAASGSRASLFDEAAGNDAVHHCRSSVEEKRKEERRREQETERKRRGGKRKGTCDENARRQLNVQSGLRKG